MNCPRCRALVLADDVNLEHLIAKCRQCQEVFRFAVEEIEAVSDRLHDLKRTEPTPAKVRAPRPNSIEIEDWDMDRRMVKRWYNSSYIGAAVFCLFWDGFLVVWYTFAVFGDNASVLMAVFPVLHVAAGVMMTYSTLAGFCNRTVIEVSDGKLDVWHGPVPWPGGLVMPTELIEQIYCCYATRTWFATQRRSETTAVTVNVNAVLKNGTQATLAAALPLEEGLFVEQQLEEWLEIKPARVPGQVVE
jgi:hypothetical protein